ncbi:MAG: hypothetical protein QF886_25170, partial [Planctomycetota bacterium]|nr:hypothetical protein [Planctomycetota bacterium]
AFKAEARDEADAALALAEKSGLRAEVRNAERAVDTFMLWYAESEDESKDVITGRLTKLVEEFQKKEKDTEAEKIFKKAEGFEKKGNLLLAEECFRYVAEQFTDSSWAEKAQTALDQITRNDE